MHRGKQPQTLGECQVPLRCQSDDRNAGLIALLDQVREAEGGFGARARDKDGRM